MEHWDEERLIDFYRDLQGHAVADDKGLIISWSSQVLLSNRYQKTLREVEGMVLKKGIMPARYQRNRNTISSDQQNILFNSKVAVIGCGGLGGYIIEEIARLGIGSILVVDYDTFEEHNLNRQLLSSVDNLGQLKAEQAKKRILDINPAVKIEAITDALSEENANQILDDVDLVFDALDNIQTRLALVKECQQLKIPLIHGAIAGWYGQVTTELPGDDTIQRWYQKIKGEKGIESNLGNPSFTPALVASLQVAEACKVLLKQGTVLSKKMLMVDLLTMEMEVIDV